MSMEQTRTEIQEIRSTLETMKRLGMAEGSLDGENVALLGSIDMNLGHALNDKKVAPMVKAAYCLGKLNDRMLHLAGDIDGYRCKDRKNRAEIRDYAEVARELAQRLVALIGTLDR